MDEPGLSRIKPFEGEPQGQARQLSSPRRMPPVADLAGRNPSTSFTNRPADGLLRAQVSDMGVMVLERHAHRLDEAQ
jgi:hypothetical protein